MSPGFTGSPPARTDASLPGNRSIPPFPGGSPGRGPPTSTRLPTEQVITTADTEFGGMFLTEVSRGCRRGCRFCAAGFVCRPARFRSAAALAPSFRRGLEKKKTIGLLGTAVSDHPALIPLCRSILDAGGSVAVGSLRLDRFSADMAALLKETGVETVSLAPEAGSQRLRDVIRKGITEEEIFSAVEKLMECDMVQVRLYFMVGLPTETDEDMDAIVRLVKGMEHHARRYSKGRKGFRRLTLSINQFIPKPGTPFQWHPLEDTAVVRRRIRRITDALQRREGGPGHPRHPEVELHPGPALAGRPNGGQAAAGGPSAGRQLGERLPGGECESRFLRLPPEGNRGDPAVGLHRPRHRKNTAHQRIPEGTVRATGDRPTHGDRFKSVPT